MDRFSSSFLLLSSNMLAVSDTQPCKLRIAAVTKKGVPQEYSARAASNRQIKERISDGVVMSFE